MTFAQPEPIFLTRASRFSLKVAIADGDPLELLLTRSMTPAEEEAARRSRIGCCWCR